MKQASSPALAKGLWFVAPLAVSAVVPLVTLPLLTRAVSPAEFGAWALATALGTFGAGISTPGLQAGFERGFFALGDGQGRACLLHSVVVYCTFSLVVAGAVIWAFRGHLALLFLGDEHQAMLIVLAFCASATSAIKALYLLYYRGRGDARLYALYSIDEVVLSAALSLIFVIGFDLGAVGLVMGQLTASAAVLILVAVRTARAARPAFAFPPLLEAIRVGYPLTPRVLIGTLSNQIDKFVLGALQSTTSVGIYSLGQRLAYLPFTASNALEHIFVPHVYASMFERGHAASEDLGRYLTPFAYLTVAVACSVVLFAEEIVWVLAPADYHGTAAVAGILAVAYAVMFFGKFPQLVYAKKMWIASALSMLTLGLNACLCVIGVRWWGALGAACGLLVTSITSGIVGFWVRQRCFPIHWEYRKLVSMFAVLVLSMIATVVLTEVGVAYAVRLIVKLVSVGLLIWVGVQCGVVSQANGRLLWATIARRPVVSL